MLTRSQTEQLLEKILKYASLPECTVHLYDTEDAFVRFANNAVTTAGFVVDQNVSVEVVTSDRKAGRCRTTDLSEESLRATVKRAEETAAVSPVNPEHVPLLGPQQYASYENFDESTAAARSTAMTPHVTAIIQAALAKKLVAAGYFRRWARRNAFATSTGNKGYSRSTDAELSSTIRRADGLSSGWAGKPSTRIGDIEGAAIASIAIEKCLRWDKPLRIEPGRYSVVLEPAATGELLQMLGRGPFSARAAEEGRSFLSKKGGGTLLGEKLFPETVTLRTEPFDKRFPTRLWSMGEVPNRPVAWIEKGVVKNLHYDRYWASKAGQEATPLPSTLMLEGGSESTSDLIKATERGLLITRFWYIRLLNPQTVQYTGLTRDGVFLIENGEITRPVMNLRFNDSPVNLLKNAKRFGRPERASSVEGAGMIAPPLLTEMTFTSISDAV